MPLDLLAKAREDGQQVELFGRNQALESLALGGEGKGCLFVRFEELRDGSEEHSRLLRVMCCDVFLHVSTRLKSKFIPNLPWLDSCCTQAVGNAVGISQPFQVFAAED